MNVRIKTKIFFLALGALATCAITLGFARGRLIDKHIIKSESSGSKASVTKPLAFTHTSSPFLKSQTPMDANTTERHFTGRSIKNEKAVKLSDSIVVARIVSLGERDLGAPGQSYYGDVKVAVIQIIKGAAPKEMSLSLTVQVLSSKFAEEKPEVNQRYIIFLQKSAPSVKIGIKLLQATEENINSVTSLAASIRKK